MVVCGERESDIFDLFDQAQDAPKNLHLLVRAQHDRLLSPGEKLWDNLWTQPVQGIRRVFLPRRQNQPARVATLQVRWSALEMAAPQVTIKRKWQPLCVCAVFAQEIDPPPGSQPIQWVL